MFKNESYFDADESAWFDPVDKDIVRIESSKDKELLARRVSKLTEDALDAFDREDYEDARDFCEQIKELFA